MFDAWAMASSIEFLSLRPGQALKYLTIWAYFRSLLGNASNGGAPNDIHNMQSLTEIYYSSHSINYIYTAAISF